MGHHLLFMSGMICVMDNRQQMAHLLTIVQNIKNQNKNDGTSEVKEKRKLRVLLLGGSVASGIGCFWPDHLNMPKQRHWSDVNGNCARSFRLEKLLNYILFDGEEMTIADNIASGGQTSEFAALILDYRLYPRPSEKPDVVISAFSPNESREPNLQQVFYEYMQDFVKAAWSLHPCNDQAPLVMMIDDFYGGLPFRATSQTGNIYMLSTWNNLMAVNYASTVKYKILAEVEDEIAQVPLLHSNYQIHPGAGMHIGLARTFMFNIINSIVNLCNDEYITDTLVNNSSATFEIDSNLQTSLEKNDPPFQHFGRMKEGIYGSAVEVREELEKNINATKSFCDQLDSKVDVDTQKCSYSWIVNPMAGFSTRQ